MTFPDEDRPQQSRPAPVRVAHFNDVEFDDSGFRQKGDREFTIRWDDVVKIAWGYEIHPIAIADWDFWAFQTDDPINTFWVETDADSPFSKSVIERYGLQHPPIFANHNHSERCISTYVMWPEASVSELMYVDVKKHWWSDPCLAYPSAD